MPAWIEVIINLDLSLYMALTSCILFAALFRTLTATERRVALTVAIYAVSEWVAVSLIQFGHYNIWWYNIILIPQVTATAYSYSGVMKPGRIVRIMQGGSGLLILLHILNLGFLQGLHEFANFTFIPVMVWLAVYSYYCLRELMEDATRPPFGSLVAWLALATLIDYAGAMPVLSVLGWAHFITSDVADKLLKFVSWLYAGWYVIIIAGLLWLKTSLRSVLLSR